MHPDLLEHLGPLYRFALRLTSNGHAADDLVQETYLRAWARRDTLREPAAARVWLYRTAVNLHRDGWRRTRARSPELPAEAVPSPPAADAGVGLDALDVAAWLRQRIDQLPDRQRHVFYLAAVEELDHATIAEVLGISRPAVKASLCAARRTLRAALALRDLGASS